MFFFVQAFSIGFSLHSTLSNGDCKTVEDWRADIATLRTWSIATPRKSGITGTSKPGTSGSGISSTESATSGASQSDLGGKSPSGHTSGEFRAR